MSSGPARRVSKVKGGQRENGESRVQLPQVSHDLIAILHSFYRLVAVDRGFVSLVHELSFTVGIWSMFLFTILLNTEYCIVLLSTSMMSPESAVSSCSGRIGEVSASLN